MTMNIRRTLLLVSFLVALMAGPAAAQEMEAETVDTVILASTENYPDALVAGAAGNKIGAPVLLTDKQQLPQETRSTLQELSPSEVVVVGGPAVVADSVISTLQSDYNVTRLWGTTRYGTAVDVAEHFWVEGADTAILVQNSFQDRNGTVLAAAKELAREDDDPVYLTPEGSVPAVVLNSLRNLDVQQVTV
ncbi:MAG: cell wall-binding repeat-containing protein, partial [Candidatus Nanohaloarchaea archaeon]